MLENLLIDKADILFEKMDSIHASEVWGTKENDFEVYKMCDHWVLSGIKNITTPKYYKSRKEAFQQGVKDFNLPSNTKIYQRSYNNHYIFPANQEHIKYFCREYNCCLSGLSKKWQFFPPHQSALNLIDIEPAKTKLAALEQLYVKIVDGLEDNYTSIQKEYLYYTKLHSVFQDTTYQQNIKYLFDKDTDFLQEHFWLLYLKPEVQLHKIFS